MAKPKPLTSLPLEEDLAPAYVKAVVVAMATLEELVLEEEVVAVVPQTNPHQSRKNLSGTTSYLTM
jgi:hypothetical protein